MYGYIGKYLYVDLSSNIIEERELPEEWAKNFIGGPALGARALWDLMPKDTPAFAEKSVVGFVCGAFNGVPAFYGGRWTVCSKSPYNGRWNDANSGGYFGVMMRRSGYDAIFVAGISEKPVYIYINNGKTEIRDASFLEGLTIPDAEKALGKDLPGIEFKYAMTGVCGDKMGYTAALMNDTHRAAARGGTAAVMGSKKLKAVVCAGTHKIDVYDSAALGKFNRFLNDQFLHNPGSAAFSAHGTSRANIMNFQNGDAYVKNWSCSFEEMGQDINEYMNFGAEFCDTNYKVASWGCANCPSRCGAIMTAEGGKWPMAHFARPEYESAGIFGPGMMNTDIYAMFRCNELCNLYGADTIGLGGTVAWAMEAFSEGVLTLDDLDGIDLSWGNADGIVAITEKICKGEGCGKILMNGSEYAANYWGKGHEYLVVAGSIEISAHDPRRMPGFARGYFADATPARHTKGSLASTGFEGKLTPEERWNPNRISGFHDIIESGVLEYGNNAGFCRFPILMFMPRNVLYGMYPALTGFEFDDLKWFLMAKRSFTIRHAFSLRDGYRRDDFTISPRLIGEPPMQAGANKGNSIDVQQLTNNLYNAMGYEYNGMPCLDMLKITGGLDNLIAEFYPKQKKVN